MFKLRFDGFGINDGASVYCERLATFTQYALKSEAKGLGELLAAAPEMLAALRLILQDDRLMNALTKEQARAVMDAIKAATK